VIINAAGEEVALEKLMGHVSDFINLELKKQKKNNKKTTVDELTKLLHENLQITNNQCHTLQVNNAPLPPVTSGGKQYSKMKKMSQAREYYLKNRKTRCDQPVLEEGDVVLAQGKHISFAQAERVVQKGLQRERIPVEHNEVTGKSTVC